MGGKQSGRRTEGGVPARGFDRELSVLESLAASFHAGTPLDQAATELLKRTFAHRNNYLVSKAAKLAAEARLFALLPDTLAAYDRFFADAAKTDPQCWAKNALARALLALEHRQKDPYLRGLRHHQLEAAWGDPVDTAGPLRAACCQALVDCPGLNDADLLGLLVEALVDTDKTVRVEAARAIGQVGGPSAALVLRLRALMGNASPGANSGKEEPEVMGAVYSALASIEGDAAIPVLAPALKSDDLAPEAAFALSELRSAPALEALTQRIRAGADPSLAAVLLSAIALTRLPEAASFLLSLVEEESRHAPAAIEALARSAPSDELRLRLERAVQATGSPRLAAALRDHLPAR